MPSGPGERYDFFLSRRGSVAAIAQRGRRRSQGEGLQGPRRGLRLPSRRELYRGDARGDQELARPHHPLTPLTTKRRPTPARSSPASRRRWRKARRSGTSSSCAARTCRCAGCLSDMSIRTSWASHDAQERKRRIIAAAERQSQAAPPPPRPFIGVPPRIASFTGRADELDRLDAILMQDKPAAVTQAS